MSDKSETIYTPLLRFKVAGSSVGDRQIKPTEREKTARQPTVVDEHNMATLFLSSFGRPATKGGS